MMKAFWVGNSTLPTVVHLLRWVQTLPARPSGVHAMHVPPRVPSPRTRCCRHACMCCMAVAWAACTAMRCPRAQHACLSRRHCVTAWPHGAGPWRAGDAAPGMAAVCPPSHAVCSATLSGWRAAAILLRAWARSSPCWSRRSWRCVRCFIVLLVRALTACRLDRCGLGDGGAVAVADALQRSSAIWALGFVAQWTGNSCRVDRCRAVSFDRAHPVLLCSVTINVMFVSSPRLLLSLSLSVSLSHESEKMFNFISLCRMPPQLLTASLGSNGIGEEGGRAIAALLARTTSLAVLWY